MHPIGNVAFDLFCDRRPHAIKGVRALRGNQKLGIAACLLPFCRHALIVLEQHILCAHYEECGGQIRKVGI